MTPLALAPCPSSFAMCVTKKRQHRQSRPQPATAQGKPGRGSDTARAELENTAQRRAALVSTGACAARCGLLYAAALDRARLEDYVGARQAFMECVKMCPSYGKAWVSWAQMEKRSRAAGAGDHLARCRSVLQQGLTLNPDSAPLCQAWGLMELQRGNVLAAVMLLERSVAYDPRCSPVLRWKAVRTARQTVGSRRRLRRSPGFPMGPQTGGFA